MTVGHHPGAEPSGPHCAPQEGCITCGDVAVEMRVVSVDADRGLALCADAAGRRCSVEIALVGPLRGGDKLLVHAGTAIAQLDPEAVVG